MFTSTSSVDVHIDFAEQPRGVDFCERVLRNPDFIGRRHSHFDFRWAILILRIGSNAADGPHIDSGDSNRSARTKAASIVETRLDVLAGITQWVNKQSADGYDSDDNDQHEYRFSEHGYTFRVSALLRVSATKPSSFGESFFSESFSRESRLISTFASAPSSAAFARAIAVVRSDFMFGLVMGLSLAAISATSTTFSATPKGTPVACLSAELIDASPPEAPPPDDLAAL